MRDCGLSDGTDEDSGREGDAGIDGERLDREEDDGADGERLGHEEDDGTDGEREDNGVKKEVHAKPLMPTVKNEDGRKTTAVVNAGVDNDGHELEENSAKKYTPAQKYVMDKLAESDPTVNKAG